MQVMPRDTKRKKAFRCSVRFVSLFVLRQIIRNGSGITRGAQSVFADIVIRKRNAVCVVNCVNVNILLIVNGFVRRKTLLMGNA